MFPSLLFKTRLHADEYSWASIVVGIDRECLQMRILLFQILYLEGLMWQQ